MLVLDRRTLALKDQLAARYADLVYEGRWWSTEREALDALVDETQKRVTGTVRLKLYKGSAMVVGRRSPVSLYDQALASFDTGTYRQADAAGFIRLFSLPTRVEAERRGGSGFGAGARPTTIAETTSPASASPAAAAPAAVARPVPNGASGNGKASTNGRFPGNGKVPAGSDVPADGVAAAEAPA